MIQLFSRGFAGLHRTIDDLRALGHVEFRRVTFQVVAAGRRNRASRAEQSRSGNRALGDGLLDFHVTVTGAFGFDIPQRGETLIQCATARVGRAGSAQRDPSVQDVRVVAPLVWLFTPQKDVRVRIDQSGENRRGRKVDHLGVAGNLRRRVGNLLNALAANEDELILARRVVRAVDHGTGANHRKRGRRSVLRRDVRTTNRRTDSAKVSLRMKSPSKDGGSLPQRGSSWQAGEPAWKQRAIAVRIRSRP